MHILEKVTLCLIYTKNITTPLREKHSAVQCNGREDGGQVLTNQRTENIK